MPSVEHARGLVGPFDPVLDALNVQLLSSCRVLAWSHRDGQLVFQIVFIVVWLGAIIVTINGQLLGGTMYAC